MSKTRRRGINWQESQKSNGSPCLVDEETKQLGATGGKVWERDPRSKMGKMIGITPHSKTLNLQGGPQTKPRESFRFVKRPRGKASFH